MKYLTATKPIKRFGIPYFLGIVVNVETKQIVFDATSMSESGLNQILNSRALRMASEDAKKQRALEAEIREIERAAKKKKEAREDDT